MPCHLLCTECVSIAFAQQDRCGLSTAADWAEVAEVIPCPSSTVHVQFATMILEEVSRSVAHGSSNAHARPAEEALTPPVSLN